MESHIHLENVSLKFRLYHNKSSSLKEIFVNFARPGGPNAYSDFWALKNIDLTLRHGDRVGIVGHNGAGKSSLLKVMARIYAPTKGRISVQGRLAPLLEIGAGFNPELSGRDNIYLNGAILGYPPQLIKELEQEIIEFARLEAFIDTPIKYYSTGMYMKLGFAIATAVHPDILLLDETFAGGDAAFVEKATKRMTDFIDRASIMVFVSHQMELLRKLCNRIIWLEQGEVVDDGPPDLIIERYLAKQLESTVKEAKGIEPTRAKNLS